MGVQIDGIHIQVSDVYKKMKKAEAVKAMLKEGFVPGKDEKAQKDWAERAYDIINPIKKGPELFKEAE